MKYAVISDIHANLQALETVLKDAEAQGAEKVVCLGDVVGYGPPPAETLRRVRSAAETVLAGNHDDAVSRRFPLTDFTPFAAAAVERHRAAIRTLNLDELRDYRFYAEDMCHPSPTAVQIIWERFVKAAVPENERVRLLENEKASRRNRHMKMR